MKKLQIMQIRGMCVLILFLAFWLLGCLGCDSGQDVDFFGDMEAQLTEFMVEELAVDPAVGNVVTDGGEVTVQWYRADKIDRVVFSSIHIKETGVYEESVFVYPEEGYEFPVLWTNLTQMSGMYILVVDFIPLQDIVMKKDYGQRYLAPLKTAKDNVLGTYDSPGILEGGVLDEVSFENYCSIYVFSPYKTIIMVAPNAIDRLADVLHEYCAAYISLVNESEMLEVGSADREYAADRLDAMLNLLQECDPGYKYMVEAFGQETTDGIFDVVF